RLVFLPYWGYLRRARRRATAALLALLVRELPEGLVGGDDHQQPPQAVAVVELGEAALGHGAEEAVEGILDDVLPVGGAGRGGPQLLAGQGDQPAVVALPQRLGGGRVPALEGRDPVRDRAGRRHGVPRPSGVGERARTGAILSPPPRAAIFFPR